MKSYEEMAKNVLDRIDEYEAERKIKRARMTKVAASVTPVCAAAVIGVALWRGGDVTNNDNAPIDTAPETTLSETVSENSSAAPGVTASVKQTEPATQDAKRKVIYKKEYPDWEPFHTVEELLSSSDTVVVGEVTDISFMTHNDMSVPPPKTPKGKVLCTVYGLDVKNVYKGSIKDHISLKMRGGIENSAYEDEQVAALGNNLETEITICADEPTLEIGATYLLILKEYEVFAGYYYPIGYYQGVYPIEPASIENGDRNSLDSEDQNHFSLKNIISFFGDDKWDSFKAEHSHKM